MEQELKLLLAKADDAVRLCELRNTPKFMGFLSPSEMAEISRSVVSKAVCFFGGYDDAERCMLGVLPDYIIDYRAAFPISALKISYRAVDKLSHRDVLGAFMSTGITRDRVGDIRFGEGFAVAFVVQEIADYLAEQISKIGRVGVTVQSISINEAECSFPPPITEDLSFTVSSPRLDAVISGLIGVSRSKAEQMIVDGLVFINSLEALKSIKKVQQNDKITIRGYGRFVITATGNFSKKGREIIQAKKYI